MKQHRTIGGLSAAVLFVIVLIVSTPVVSAQTPPGIAAAALSAHEADVASFDTVWSTIRDTHWQENPGGLDWEAIRKEYQPRVDAAKTRDEARAVMSEMLSRLQQTHFGILPSKVYSAVGSETPDNPGEIAFGAADTGIDPRIIDGHAVVVSVAPGSPAERAGVRPGWIVDRVRGESLDEVIRDGQAGGKIRELVLTRALQARMSGNLGGTIEVEFLTDAEGDRRRLELALAPPRGKLINFGNAGPEPVWYEEKFLPIGDDAELAYARFNFFLDVPLVMGSFQRSVEACVDRPQCKGLIVDLRGNPGGIGGMAMGMAGFLVNERNLRLGTMYMRDATLNFVINPRPKNFKGPVAILVDGLSASTAEIFAGGLQDLGRARVFGTPSAAAALPSIIQRLPNGDGFQYAVADYISQGGEPLEARGVAPDEVVNPTREGLLAGHDEILEAAERWIATQVTGE